MDQRRQFLGWAAASAAWGAGLWPAGVQAQAAGGGARLLIGAPAGGAGDTFLRRIDQGELYQCRCGTSYVRDRSGRRFLESGPEGISRPFMRHSRWGRWRPDLTA